jgi:hypothetical protein
LRAFFFGGRLGASRGGWRGIVLGGGEVARWEGGTMRGVWVAVLSAGLVVSAGGLVRAQVAAKTSLSKADRKAQDKTQKAEKKAAKNNAKAARDQVKAEERQDKASTAGEKMPGRMAAVQAPPM